jgi:polysaccharide deacetylase 2 family uncharacterized protein YibQ
MQTLNAPLPENANINANLSAPTEVPAADPVMEKPLEPGTAQQEDSAPEGVSEAVLETGPAVADETPDKPDGDTAEAPAAEVAAVEDAPAQTGVPAAPEVSVNADAAPETSADDPQRPDPTATEVPEAEAPPAEMAAPDAPEASADTAPAITNIPRPEVGTQREPAVIVEIPEDEAPARPEASALPKGGETVEVTPRIGTPATRLTDDDALEGGAAPVEEMADLPPLQKYAVPFANPDNKPLMSIILLDRGDTALGVEALSAFPYPLSFAVDVTSPEALARMETYRAAGFEVLALSDIPVGATAADTETLLRAGLRELPEVVAVMEGDDTGLQSDKAVSDQVSAVLQESGHGAVFFAKGLNTAQKLARKNGVASASVFRDFDGNGQSATVMRRFLDQAAFKARQQPEGVVMVGRLQPETISALLLWGLQDRASRVALAPVSALLR